MHLLTAQTGSGYAKYYLIKNLHGDVVQLRDVNNSLVANYEYDAWGNLVSVKNASGATITSGIAIINPIRYKGYYYDNETGFYYLKARYYDPANCRFISTDDIVSVENGTKGVNLFSYCFNDPINLSDYTGEWPDWATKLIVGAVCAVAAVAVTVATAGTGAAAVVPALIAVGKTVAVSTVIGAAAGTIDHRVSTGSWEGAGEAALNGAAEGFMWGGIGALGTAGVGALQSQGRIPKRVNVDNLLNNADDPFVTIEPKQGRVTEIIKKINSTGHYERPYVKALGKGLYEIQNGHHTVQAMKSIGRKTISVWLTK